jgi:hypothetical protein
MAKIKDERSNNGLSVFTKPWFVLAVVVVCFAILTPKIFLPIFKQLLGFGAKENSENFNNVDRIPPRMRQGPSPADSNHPKPQFGRPGPMPHTTQQSASSSKSFLNFLLPIYAVGIGLYMIYTLFKVFQKDEKKNENEEESDYEPSQTNTAKFKQRNFQPNVNWDASDGRFKFAPNGYHFPRSEESEDELNDYEAYRNLDPDYVSYLKKLRREKRKQASQQKLNSKSIESPNLVDLGKADEIPLTPNIGLTSITNTNVLMNDTLERMKHTLNKINSQLSSFEKKGKPLDDPELDMLRLQFSQTEQQMSKIINIMNKFSTTIDNRPETREFNNKEFSDHEVSNDDQIYENEDIISEDVIGIAERINESSKEQSKTKLRNRKSKQAEVKTLTSIEIQNHENSNDTINESFSSSDDIGCHTSIKSILGNDKKNESIKDATNKKVQFDPTTIESKKKTKKRNKKKK